MVGFMVTKLSNDIMPGIRSSAWHVNQTRPVWFIRLVPRQEL